MGGTFCPTRFHPLIFMGFFCLCFAVNYPGRVNPDSFEQLEATVVPALLTDWHAPVVTWLWSVPGLLLGQPAGALFVQCLCFSLFAAVLPILPERNWHSWTVLSAEAFFRLTLVAIAGIVVKDVTLTAIILALFAAAQMARHSERPIVWIGWSIALALPCLFVRPTNFLMVLFAWALVSVMLVRTMRSHLGWLAVAAVLLVMVVPVNAVINRSLLGATNAHAEKQLIVFDVAGISHGLGKDEFLTLPQWPRNLPDPIRCYTPKRWNPFYFIYRCHAYAPTFDRVVARTGGLEGWWLSEIAHHPIAYLRHRLAYAHKLIRTPEHIIRPQPPYADTFNRAEDPRYHSVLYNDELDARLYGAREIAHIARWHDNIGIKPFAKLSNALFGQRNVYLVAFLVCLALLGWSIRRHFANRPVDPMIAIAAATGAGNVGMLVFLGVASDGRYLLPTICCAAVALLITLRRLVGREVAPSGTPSRPLRN